MKHKKFLLSEILNKKPVLVIALLLLAAAVVFIKESAVPSEYMWKATETSPCVYPETKVQTFYSFWHATGQWYGDQNSHPLAEGALVTFRWSAVEKQRNQFSDADWSTLDNAIAGWTGSTNPNYDSPKKAIIGVVPYSTWWANPSDASGNPNGDTPTWVYNYVPKITFKGGADVN